MAFPWVAPLSPMRSRRKPRTRVALFSVLAICQAMLLWAVLVCLRRGHVPPWTAAHPPTIEAKTFPRRLPPVFTRDEHRGEVVKQPAAQQPSPVGPPSKQAQPQPPQQLRDIWASAPALLAQAASSLHPALAAVLMPEPVDPIQVLQRYWSNMQDSFVSSWKSSLQRQQRPVAAEVGLELGLADRQEELHSLPARVALLSRLLEKVRRTHDMHKTLGRHEPRMWHGKAEQRCDCSDPL